MSHIYFLVCSSYRFVCKNFRLVYQYNSQFDNMFLDCFIMYLLSVSVNKEILISLNINLTSRVYLYLNNTPLNKLFK